MLKSLLGICILAVFFREAFSDADCYIEKVKEKDPVVSVLIAAEMTDACRTYRDTILPLHQAIRSCGVDKVTVSGLEKLIRDICMDGTTSQKSFDNSKYCLRSRMFAGYFCAPRVNLKGTFKEQQQERCQNRHEMYDCLYNDVGTPCGTDGQRIVTYGTEAMETFYEEYCNLIDGASVNKMALWCMLLGVLLSIMMAL